MKSEGSVLTKERSTASILTDYEKKSGMYSDESGKFIVLPFIFMKNPPRFLPFFVTLQTLNEKRHSFIYNKGCSNN